MAYIGREPQIGNYQVCDAISVVNAQAAYTMQVSSVNVIPESVNHMIVSLNGVIQNPGSSYTISSSTITFSSNLATGDSIDFIYLLGNTLDLGTPSDSTVTSAKLSGNLVTPGTLDVNGQELILDADADTSITADTDDQIDIKVAGADDFQITANTLTALSGSTIKADTIAETTGANGVAVDGLTIKDGKLNTDDSVVTANITDANVTSAKLASDAVTTAKITDANVTSAKIAGDAITAAKIADDAISEEHLDVTSITGHTAETSIADGDTILIHDASASALRKMTKANFVSGVGGDNTPAFAATMSADQDSLSDDTFALVAFNTEVFDSDNAYTNTSSNYKFTVPSGEGGKYLIIAHVMTRNAADWQAKYLRLNKNGNFLVESVLYMTSNILKHDYSNTVSIATVQNLSADDYIQVYVKNNGTNTFSIKAEGGYFSMHKLIGV